MIIYLCQKRAVKWLCYSLFTFVGGCPDVEITRPQSETDSVSLFATHLYPLIKKYQCGNCHTTMKTEQATESKEQQRCRQNPCFAVDDAKEAHDILLSAGKVDLDNPGNSQIAVKVGGGHNCPAGVTCDIVANNFIDAIEKWKKGLGEARAKLIQTYYLDITAVDTNRKTIWYDLRHLVQGIVRQQNNTGPGTMPPQTNTGQATGLMQQPDQTGPGNNFMQQPPTQQFSQVPQQIFTGLGNCPANINTCLEVDVHKDSGNGAYFIDRFEIKTDTATYVKNIHSLLNGSTENNFPSADCVVQPREGFNFSPNFSNVPITDKTARQQMLAFRFDQLRLATANDVNYCTEKKQQEVVLDGPTLFRSFCTASCHNGTGGGNRTDFSSAEAKQASLTEVQEGSMPQARAQQPNNTQRQCLINFFQDRAC